jgi:hypothetical protein
MPEVFLFSLFKWVFIVYQSLKQLN